MKIFNNENFHNNSEFININKDYSEININNKAFLFSRNERKLENLKYVIKEFL